MTSTPPTLVESPTISGADAADALAAGTDIDLAALLAVSPQTADLLFREAHSVQGFTDEPVTDDEVHAAYDLMRWGPTAMNISPLRYTIVRSADARARLVEHMSGGNKDKTLAAPLSLIVAADTNFHDQLGILAPHRASGAAKFAADDEGRASMSRMNGLIQVGYFIPALRAVGLHVGPMAGFDADAVDAEFHADNGWKALLVFNLGQPAEEGAHHPRAPRLSPRQVSRSL